MTTFGLMQFGGVGDDGGERGDIDGRVSKRHERGADVGGVDGRQIALHVDHDVDAVFGVERLQSLVDAVGAGDVIAARHDGAAAGFFHRRRNGFRIGRDHRFADSRRLGAPQHVHDHRDAMQIGQWLAGQAGRCEAGRDEDNCVGH